MQINASDRPIEIVKEEVIEVLIYNYSHGNINEEAFERRLDVVVDSNDAEKIVSQVADLDPLASDMTKDFNAPDMSIQYSTEETTDAENVVCIFAGSDRKGPWLVPSKINVITVFGGANIDLSQGIFTSKTVTLKVFCMFGGININVPEGVRVSTSTVNMFAGINNKIRSSADYDGPILRVEGLVLFGGVDIKIKQTIKEKFTEFANQMKSMFDSKI
ncbi:DUF1707 and DUF2154 domain-containing protein [Alteromonas sp. 5E99-2]|uniref:LiaF domain-containing protein n=1 Tax=Alteromonas sp. 5E99-2 TaxID=2817683 RepID=UPI001A985D5D|nr:LiaF domain-containing protein [Alteromonas sp. 5E99-2]MBO1255809.1 DUF1707 and DUF2154 domain-containing protein [Alteromonas sp. 5E99-2]